MNIFFSAICIARVKAGLLIAIMMLSGASSGICQTPLPEILTQGSIQEQLAYIQERTRIYEGYRAIREDMFQTFSRNVLDSLNDARLRINNLMLQVDQMDIGMDSLVSNLEATQTELEVMTRTKNSIRLLGLEVRKIPYNAVMWTIIAGLILLLGSGYLAYKQTRSVTMKTKKDLSELKDEFEEYRVKTRLEREKTAMNHFNEIKKLKGS